MNRLMYAEAGGVTPELVRERKFLQPGQLIATAKPTAVTTILGSCVAVCLFDRSRRIGGVNHFLLAMHAGGSVASPRFGNVAIDMLLEQMRALGARLPLLEAQIFGGACMFQQMASPDHLGLRNVEVARTLLSARGIDVVRSDVGGSRGRKLIFNTDEGMACLNLI